MTKEEDKNKKYGLWILFFGMPIFLSAFLLFQIQPLIGRYILPWFGGGASVWTVCMFFFQAMLVLGYSYAYLSGHYFKFTKQLTFFAAFLLIGIFFSHIIPNEKWKFGFSGWPALRVILLLLTAVGAPCFILSVVSPLFQSWFSRIGSVSGAYKLYAWSNLASFSALLSYPFFVEPFFGLKKQAFFWSAGFIVFVIFAFVLIVKLRKADLTPAGTQFDAKTSLLKTRTENNPNAITKLLWFGLSACGVIFLLSITNEIAQNIPSFPLLWILTLSIYLLSFIICFYGPDKPFRISFVYLFAFSLLLLSLILYFQLQFSVFFMMILFLLVLFGGCMICQGVLVKIRTRDGAHIPLFYLLISAGGAFGGFFSGILSPLVFKTFFEFYIAVFLIVFAAAAMCFGKGGEFVNRNGAKRYFSFIALLFACVVLILYINKFSNSTVALYRNFYGISAVFQFKAGDADTLSLRNGSTLHGFQYRDGVMKKIPTAYFSKNSGIGRLMSLYDLKNNLRVGIIGLGIGTLAAYGKKGDLFRFYEINPQVEEIAKKYFTYLSDSAAVMEVVLGDARLSLEKEPPQEYDIFVLDAFSGDAIPVHLLTKEAMEIYFRHLKHGGVLAFHISNDAVDLSPVIYKAAEYFGCKAVVIETGNGGGSDDILSQWVIMSENEAIFENIKIKEATHSLFRNYDDIRLWTDDYSNLFETMMWRMKSVFGQSADF